MPYASARVIAEYPLGPDTDEGPLIVADLRPAGRRAAGRNVMPAEGVAEQIAPHIQHEAGRTAWLPDFVKQLANHILTEPRYSVVFSRHVGGRILAFGFLGPVHRRLVELPEHALGQFGVTSHNSVYDLDSKGRPAVHLLAAVALLDAKCSALPEGSLVYVVPSEKDEMRGDRLLARDAGFVPADPGVPWRSGGVLVARPEEVCDRLRHNERYGVLFAPQPAVTA